jgi:secreted trypsin-like serine protease
MSLMRHVLAVLLGCLATSAQALVGPADDGDAFADRVVMVLKRAPAGASFCSAVVIARDVVLTAAHCVGRPGDTRVHFKQGGAPVLLDVAAIAVHPQYRADAIRTRERTVDLALVRTAEPLPQRYSAARIHTAPVVPVGTLLRIAGFGVSREGTSAGSGVLRAGALVVRAPQATILLWAEDPQGRGLGACTGDSGGPIFDVRGDAVVAITDWSAGNSRTSHCGRLTQGTLVAPQAGWIAEVLARWDAR